MELQKCVVFDRGPEQELREITPGPFMVKGDNKLLLKVDNGSDCYNINTGAYIQSLDGDYGKNIVMPVCLSPNVEERVELNLDESCVLNSNLTDILQNPIPYSKIQINRNLNSNELSVNTVLAYKKVITESNEIQEESSKYDMKITCKCGAEMKLKISDDQDGIDKDLGLYSDKVSNGITLVPEHDELHIYCDKCGKAIQFFT